MSRNAPLKGTLHLAYPGDKPEAASPGKADRRQLRLAETGPATPFSVRLLRDGTISSDDLIQALEGQSRQQSPLVDVLRARSLLPEAEILQHMAQHHGVPLVDPMQPLPDIALVDRLGAVTCLREGLLPWQKLGGKVMVATADPDEFLRNQARLEAEFGPVRMVLAPLPRIHAALAAQHGQALARDAETRVLPQDSCRELATHQGTDRTILVLAALALALWLHPVALGLALTVLALVSLVMLSILKLVATMTALRTPRQPKDPDPETWPVISVIVALYDEADIAARLIQRLSRLDYPAERLDIILAVEHADKVTRDALDGVTLPRWMRVIVVPAGKIQTKPRALNVALDHARGTIVGVYDAEDAPAPDQLRRVAARFAAAPAKVACLQGMLDFYNPSTNWLSRCFTIEYAVWFRLVLPGLARLGLVVPLGGTTLFFRRHALEELGGWDAYNVTEDADLGLRLARYGYQTEVIDTVTEEEANCRTVPWIKQRSRWIKGYILTWTVHHRNPALLWRQLGAWRFFGVQLLFLGTLTQVLVAPLLWSFWLVPLDIHHPVAAVIPPRAWTAMFLLFLGSEMLSIILGIVALGRTRHRLSRFWVPTLHLYFPLASLASYKAAWEAVAKPFFWDKTRHGLHDQA